MNFICIKQSSNEQVIVQYNIQQLINKFGLRRKEVMRIMREAYVIHPYRNVILLKLGKIPLIITRHQVLIMASILTTLSEAQELAKYIQQSRQEIEQSIWELAIIEAVLQCENKIIAQNFYHMTSIMTRSEQSIYTILNGNVKQMQNHCKELYDVLDHLMKNQDLFPFISFQNQDAFYNPGVSQPVSRSPSVSSLSSSRSSF